eukprot:4255406-Amphidinium_carterae.1
MQNSNNLYSRSGQTTCSSNQTMVHQSTVCMAWAHQSAVHSLHSQSTMLQRYRTTGRFTSIHNQLDIYETSGQ